MFEVFLVVRVDPGSVEAISSALEDAPFAAEVVSSEDGAVSLRCSGIGAAGFNAFPEALRVAQVGLSSLFRSHVPAFAEKGLLWGDVVSAHVQRG